MCQIRVKSNIWLQNKPTQRASSNAKSKSQLKVSTKSQIKRVKSKSQLKEPSQTFDYKKSQLKEPNQKSQLKEST